MMTVIVCIDDDYGMMFGARRQSRDRAVQERLLAMSRQNTVWMSRYSARMFEDASSFRVDDDYLKHMHANDACFVEDGTLDLSQADTLILYRWNRRYPADRRFPADVLASDWTLTASCDFVGTSHECITETVYQPSQKE